MRHCIYSVLHVALLVASIATTLALSADHEGDNCVHLVVKSVCHDDSPVSTLKAISGVRGVQILSHGSYLVHYRAPTQESQVRLMHQQGLDDVGGTLGPCFEASKSTFEHHISLELRNALLTCSREQPTNRTSSPVVLEVVLEATSPVATAMAELSAYMLHLNTSSTIHTQCDLSIDAPQHPSWSRRFKAASVASTFRDGHFRVTLRSGLCLCKEAVLFLGGVGTLGIRFVDMAPTFTPQNNIATTTLQSETTADRPVWSHGLTGRDEVVGVADTGLDYDSCFFDDTSTPVAFHPNTNPKHRKVLSYVECEDNGVKEHGDIANAHGTHVTGSLAGHSPSSNDGYDGMAKHAKVVFHDLTCGRDQSILVPPDIGDFYDVSYQLGVRLQSNSWGGVASQTYSFTDRSSDIFLYEHQDMLAVFAAGNVANAGVIIPGSGKNILSVAAHRNSNYPNERDQAASFSARGPTYDGRSKPDLAAPGQSVTSARSDGSLTSHNCDVQSKSGTSMATPLVSGSGVLMRQYFNKGFYPTGAANAVHQRPNVSGPLIKALLIHSTKGSGYNTAMGFGRLQLERVMRFDATANDLSIEDYKVIPHGGTHEYCFTSTNGADGVVTLVWHDSAMAAEGTKNMPIVNDIDVAVIAEDGTMVRGNGGSDWDRTNNVEQIRFSGGKFKKFKVVVHGHNIQDSVRYRGQPYSLVVTAGGLTTSQLDQCASFKCPNACSGKGVCTSGSCVCDASHHHVDCGQCNSTSVCHGRGTCDLAGTCSCYPHVETGGAEGATCKSCSPGWFGPLCDFNCDCKQGVCDNEAGRCLCGNAPAVAGADTAVCWDGRKCDQCCVDHGGPTCGERSYWCHAKKVRRINITSSNPTGLIQINGRGSYDNGDSCHWELVVTEGSASDITLSVASHFSVERPYDWLEVIDAGGTSKKFNGQLSANYQLVKSSSMTLNFFADLMQNDKGFELRYSVVFPPTPPPAPTTPTSSTPTAASLPTETSAPEETTAPPPPTLAPITCIADSSYCDSPLTRPSCLLNTSLGGVAYACTCDTTSANYRGQDTCPSVEPKVAARLLSGSRPYVVQFINDASLGTGEESIGTAIGVVTAGLLVGMLAAQLFNRKLFGRALPEDEV